MAFHIRNPDTDRLARRVAARKKIGLTQAVHDALQKEWEREEGKPSLVEISAAFARKLRAMSDPAKGLPVDKDFIDGLYED
jgi:antitoxin VapB